MFLRLCSPRSTNSSFSLSRTCSKAAFERQIPPGLAMPSSRAAIFTPSPIRSPSASSTTSPRWMPIRNSMRLSGATPALRSTIALWTSMAQFTASTTLRKGRNRSDWVTAVWHRLPTLSPRSRSTQVCIFCTLDFRSRAQLGALSEQRGPMSDFELPNTRYALSGDVNIAFQVMGDGPIDIILVPGIVSHIDFLHEFPGYTGFLRRLATFARVVTFDKRGQGLSDGISGAPSLEQRVDDVRAIMDDIGSQRAVLLGFSEGSPMSAFFAAANPERVSKLILFGGFAKALYTEEVVSQRVKIWGTGAVMARAIASLSTNPDGVKLLAKFERLSASPGTAHVAEQADRRDVDIAER